MSYDNPKTHDGRSYTGMTVGGRHHWDYRQGRWSEEKLGPEKWRFTFSSLKRRNTPAPEGSGCARDTRYHWYILADQRVRKVDKDCYETFMSGLKFKVGHRRPHWRKMSYEYPEQKGYSEKVEGILRGALSELEAEKVRDARRAGAAGQRVLEVTVP